MAKLIPITPLMIPWSCNGFCYPLFDGLSYLVYSSMTDLLFQAVPHLSTIYSPNYKALEKGKTLAAGSMPVLIPMWQKTQVTLDALADF